MSGKQKITVLWKSSNHLQLSKQNVKENATTQ